MTQQASPETASRSEIPDHILTAVLEAQRTYGLNSEVTYEARFLNGIAILGKTAVVKWPHTPDKITESKVIGLSPERLAAQAGGDIEREEAFLWQMRFLQSVRYLPPPPIEVPTIIANQFNPDKPTLIKYLPGEAVATEELDRFTDTDRLLVGYTVGEFIAWVSKVQSLADFHREEAHYKRTPPYDREIAFPKRVQDAKEVLRAAPATFRQRVRDTLDAYTAHKQAGRLEPTMVGHKDLASSNMIFEDNKLVGIIDFGIATPSSPARELAHLRLEFGKEAALAAACAYEDATGEPIDMSLVDLWAGIYLFDMCIAQLQSQDHTHLPPHFISRIKTLYPEDNFELLEGGRHE